jgi:hypothetical protein
MTGTRRDATAAFVLGLLAAALLAQNADAQVDWSANFMVPVCKKFLMTNSLREALAATPSSAFDQGICSGVISGLAYTAKFLPPNCP